jgi:mycothiol synthase
MAHSTTNPSPPNLPGLSWRPISRNDLAAVVELARLCLLADGGLPFLFEPDVLLSRYFPDAPGTGTGAFAPDGRLLACATVHLSPDSGPQRAMIVGQVRPDQRNQGFGAYLMRWSQVQARSLLAGAAENPWVLQVSTESLTGPAHRLYRAHGFENVFESLVMERDLHLPLPDQPLPTHLTLAIWQPELAERFFQAYQAAFRARPGFPGWSAAEWIARVTANDLVPEWSLLASAGETPLGFVIGTIDLTTAPPGGYVWQIGVIPAQRRRGIGSALLVETMRRMQAAGAASALLTVHLDNPEAIEAYTRLGFTTIGRRARYELTSTSLKP